MNAKSRSPLSVEKLVEEQFRKWRIMDKESKKEPLPPVITVSREPGSEGRMVASQLVKQLNLDMFGSKIIDEVAKSANMSERVIRTLDEKGRSILDELVQALERERHLWDYEYLSHLIKVIATIGKHGRAVILGRGANFILQPDKTLKVRVVAPLEMRVKNISREFGVSEEEARRCVINAESDRMAFVRKYFHVDCSDPMHYDLVINTANVSIDTAVKIVKTALKLKMSAQ